MPKTDSDIPALSLEELLANIRREAGESPEPASAVVPAESPVAVPRPEPGRTRYRREEFLVHRGEAFVRHAYRALLDRDADEGGLRTYLGRMNDGVSRSEVLVDLLRSPEGRARGVSVTGLGSTYLGSRLAKGLTLLRQRRLSRSVRRLLRRREEARAGAWPVQLARQLAQVEVELARLRHRHQEQAREADRRRDRLADELSRRAGALEGRLAALEPLQESTGRMEERLEPLGKDVEWLLTRAGLLQGRITALQSVQDRLTRDLAHPEAVTACDRATLADLHQEDRLDAYYLAFEDACRGDPKVIRDQFRVYMPYVEGAVRRAPGPVLDLGCGRGEWLDLLGGRGHEAAGIDLSPVMVDACRRRGLRAEQADAVSHLRGLPEASLAVVSGFHIIEHLPFPVLFDLFAEAVRVLRPGGIVIFETPNPENVLVGAHTFYHDPTHRNPMTPTAVSFLAEYHGFAGIEILRLHPYPESARLPGEDLTTARMNGFFCGPQDFALIARRAGGEG